MVDDIRYPGLWSHYVAYMKAALALIRKHEVEIGRRVKWETVLQLFEPLQKLPEFGNLHAFIASSPLADRVFVDDGGKPIGQAEAQSRWLMKYVMPILTRYVDREGAADYVHREGVLDFDEARARAIYADLEASLECTEAVYSAVAPLQHFEGPDQEIRVDATLVLRKLTQLEKQLMWYVEEFGGRVDRSMEFCLAASIVAERYAPVGLSAVRGPLMPGLTALRLLKSGQVGVPAVMQYNLKPEFGPYGGFERGTFGAPAAPGPGYTLLLEESESLVGLYEALAEAAPPNNLRVALRRFDYAYERTRPEDRLIDHWVALEALFLPDISQELSFRASLRIAYYVAGTPDEREEVFRKMRLSYDTRSDVVHGQRLKADVNEVASDTEEIVRRALRAVVTNPGSLNVDRLDAAIARGADPAQKRTLE